MNGMHPLFSFDLAKLARDDEMRRARRSMLIHEAQAGQKRNASIVRSVRRAFGGAIISVGQRIHGERREILDVSPSPAELRMAR